MLRVHMLRDDEVDTTGPGLDWISPERRMSKDKAEFIVELKCEWTSKEKCKWHSI